MFLNKLFIFSCKATSDNTPLRKLETPGFPRSGGVLDFCSGKYTVYTGFLCGFYARKLHIVLKKGGTL